MRLVYVLHEAAKLQSHRMFEMIEKKYCAGGGDPIMVCKEGRRRGSVVTVDAALLEVLLDAFHEFHGRFCRGEFKPYIYETRKRPSARRAKSVAKSL